MLLPIKQPFHLAHSLESAQAFRWRPHGGGWYSGTIGGALFLLRQVPGGLAFRATAPHEEAVLALHSYFRLDDDLLHIYRSVNRDARIAAALRRWWGMRLLRLDPWETLVSFLASMHSNVPRITRNVEAVATALGEPVTLPGGPPHPWEGPPGPLPDGDSTTVTRYTSITRHAFPPPERVAAASEGVLRELGLGFRAPFIAQAAEQVASGEVPLERLRTLPYEEAKALLLRLPGVGDKVADCVLLLAGEKLDAFPIDRWVQRALHEWYVGGMGLKRYRDLRAWAVGYFGPWAGYAQQYLFHHRRVGVGRGTSHG